MRRATVIALMMIAAATAVAQEATGSAEISVPRELTTLPVLYEGRSMPLESAGRLVLYRLAGRSRVGELDAGQWFVRLLLDPFRAIEDQVFLVNNPATLDAIGYPDPDRGRFSYVDLFPTLSLLNTLAVELVTLGRDLDVTEQELVELANNVRLFEGLASTFDIFRSPASGGSADSPTDTIARQFFSTDQLDQADLGELPGMLRLLPVSSGDEVRWLTPPRALNLYSEDPSGQSHLRALLESWDIVLPAYLLPDDEALDHGAALLAADLSALRSEGYDLGPTAFETFYNQLQPVRWAAWALALALVVYLLLRRNAGAIRWARFPIGVAVMLLTAHQLLRFIITHRPPVTDLPASFLFVTWIVVIVGFALTFSRLDAARIGVLLGTVTGLGLVYLARLVTGGADSFGIVRAVLDTNFWLTTHVLVITAGYAGVVAAAVTGHIYLIGRLARPYRSATHQTTYRVMFVLLLAGLALSFLGTILGGIWADQSWGRFWGWDPKENGALLIVLWASIALHARVTRWFDRAAFAAAAVLGNIVVLFSWLGVNLMGIGLHSYGFNDSSFFVLVGVSGAEIIFAVGGWFWVRFGTHERGMGQHVGLKPEGFDHAKPFSFVDAGADKSRFLISANGALSEYLAEKARTGEPLWMSQPSGEFVFGTQSGREVVMVAGGVGIAPILGLARAAASGGHTTTLICANRDHVYLDDELQRLEAEHANLVVIRVMSRPAEYWSGAIGRVSPESVGALLADAGRSGAGADWYICGSSEFCDAARDTARAIGASQVLEEEFAGALEPPAPPSFAAEAVFLEHDRPGGRTVRIRPGQTILSAALDAGLDIPHSCMSGTCGECRCTVTAGSAVQAGDPRDAGAGDEILGCVAYPGVPTGLVFNLVEKQT